MALWIPDLLLEVASHLSDPADISRFSKCNRMSREMIMPLVFRNICIPIQKASSVAYVLGKYPHYARRCSLFSFEGSPESERLKYDQYLPMFEHLAAVLHTLAENAHVKSVWWCRKSTIHHSISVVAPAYIWQALSALSRSLEELRIYIIDGEDNWHPICAPEYPQLRMLDVWLKNGRDFSPLQVMLNGLSRLEDLKVYLPPYKPAFGFDLSSYHHHLRTFSFAGRSLPSSFLHRHSTIERLHLRIKVTDGFTLGDHDLPLLNVLRVDGPTMSNTPSLFSPSARRPITHLRLDDGRNSNMDFLAESTLATLRHLEIECSTLTFRQNMLLFQHFSQLEELRIKVHFIGLSLCEEDIVKLLLCLSESTSLIHLQLQLRDVYGHPLSEPFLSDIGAVPASLEYLTWTTNTYRLESREGKTVAVPVELPKTIVDFTD